MDPRAFTAAGLPVDAAVSVTLLGSRQISHLDAHSLNAGYSLPDRVERLDVVRAWRGEPAIVLTKHREEIGAIGQACSSQGPWYNAGFVPKTGP